MLTTHLGLIDAGGRLLKRGWDRPVGFPLPRDERVRLVHLRLRLDAHLSKDRIARLPGGAISLSVTSVATSAFLGGGKGHALRH
jgi:hypothetical protein